MVRRDGSIDMVFRLRPLGRLWLYARALLEFARTSTITLTIDLGGSRGRPAVKHAGERVDPSPDYVLDDREVDELVKRVPAAKLPFLIHLAQARHLAEMTMTSAERRTPA